MQESKVNASALLGDDCMVEEQVEKSEKEEENREKTSQGRKSARGMDPHVAVGKKRGPHRQAPASVKRQRGHKRAVIRRGLLLNWE